jgi:hypothetical protein
MLFARKTHSAPRARRSVEYTLPADARFIAALFRERRFSSCRRAASPIAEKHGRRRDPPTDSREQDRAQLADRGRSPKGSSCETVGPDAAVRRPLLAHRGALKVDLSDGYYLAKDNRTLIMLVKPAHRRRTSRSRGRLLAPRREDAEAVRATLLADGAGGRDEPCAAAAIRRP